MASHDIYGLIGRSLNHSFSQQFFTQKFEKENIAAEYHNFEIDEISFFPQIIKNVKNLRGLNVTIPYKEAIIPYLDQIDDLASKVGSVNVISVTSNGKLIGHNSDVYGLTESLKHHINPKKHNKALVLGTGGASKSVYYVLNKLGLEVAFVSRTMGKVKFVYDDLTPEIIVDHTLIVNTTPVGQFPNINEYPNLPYEGISENHICFDLIYNPVLTKFLEKGRECGAMVVNGGEMLKLQAERSWQLWNNKGTD